MIHPMLRDVLTSFDDGRSALFFSPRSFEREQSLEVDPRMRTAA